MFAPPCIEKRSANAIKCSNFVLFFRNIFNIVVKQIYK